MQRALAEMVLLGIAGGALGCWVVLYELSYAAESLAHSIFPGLVVAALAGIPLLLGAAPAIVVAALAIAARRAGRRRSSRDVGVAVVVTTMFGARRAAGALAGLAARDRDACSSATSSARPTPTCSPRRRWSSSSPSALWLLHGRLLATGFDRGSARALGLSPALARRRAAGPARRGDRRRRAGPRQPARRRRLRRPGRGRPPAHRPDRADDRCSPPRSRCSPASPASTSPTTRAPPAAPRWRWRSSPSTCSRCRWAGCWRGARRGGPDRRLRSLR